MVLVLVQGNDLCVVRAGNEILLVMILPLPRESFFLGQSVVRRRWCHTLHQPPTRFSPDEPLITCRWGNTLPITGWT